jgi:diguanylate cyclase (GGDEF)-like protein/PAS domain S-box-containing protein
MRGWQWAMSHPEETVELILKYYARGGDRQHLLYEAHQMVPLVQPVLVEIGYMNPERWRHIADVYAGLGMVPKQVSLDGFLYNVDSSASRLRWLYRALAAVAVLLLVGAVIHYSMLTRERRRTNAEIRAGEKRFRTMFEASPLGIALIDSVTYEYRDINPRYQEILGRSHEVLSNMRWLDSGHPDDVAQVKTQMTRLMAREISNFKVSNRMFRSDGEMVWIAVSVTAIETPPDSHALHLCMIEDVTDKKQTEQLIWHQANFDPLTQLPNRRMFLDRLALDLLKSQRSRSRIAILFIDLDHFKEVNDTLGHHQGDVLLIDAARRISDCVRKSDTVARLGGDEFTVILSDLDSTERWKRIAQNIIDRMRQPFALGQEQACVGQYRHHPVSRRCRRYRRSAQACRSGHVCGQGRRAQPLQLLHAGAAGGSPDAHAPDQRFAQCRQGQGAVLPAHRAPEDGPHPQGRSADPLAPPTRGLVSPLDFIPLAEASGLIFDIGSGCSANRRAGCSAGAASTIRTSRSASTSRRWNSSATMAVIWNGSARCRPDAAGQALVVEITEGMLLDASTTVSNKLLQLRDAGIQVALDDFGTGYSSLSYLKKFDIDYLKIDRSFTRNLAPDSSDMALSDAIIVMAHKLGLRVIAEGVETEQQRALLAEAGCDYGQGYLFSRPIPAQEFDAMLRAQQL